MFIINSFHFAAFLVYLVKLAHSWNPNPTYEYDYSPHNPYFEDIFPYPLMPSNVQPQHFQTTQCKCVKLKDCLPLVMQILRLPHPLPKEYVSDIQQMSCGYDHKEPMVCCDDVNRNIDTKTKQDEPWIWDISLKNSNNDHPIYTEVLNNRAYSEKPIRNSFDQDFRPFKRNKESKVKKPFNVNFEDPRSKKNRPLSFSTDFIMPDHCVDMKIPNVQFPQFHQNRGPNFVHYPNEIDTTSQQLRLLNPINCGVSINSRIIGGDDAGPGQFPWIARLAFRNRSSGLVSYRCSGTIINDHYVLTAAHCVTNLVHDIELAYVRLGELDERSNLCETDSSICSQRQDFEIESIIYHEQYDSPKFANDIALIRLRMAANSTFISPICLPVGHLHKENENLNGKTAIVAGWGASQMNSVSNHPILQWLRLPIVDTINCAQAYAKFSANSRSPIIITDHQICVQGKDKLDACQGDSGGPLIDDNNSGDQHILLGIVSFGPKNCGVSSFPGVYARISPYMGWILKNIH